MNVYTMVVSSNKKIKSMDAYMFGGKPTHLDDLNATYKRTLRRENTIIHVCGNGDRLSDSFLSELARMYMRGEWTVTQLNPVVTEKGKSK